MTIYSHSRLSTFEQCPYRFKLKYLDKIKPEIEQTIEAHLGKCTHDALEWLYNQVIKYSKVPTITEIIDKYTSKWQTTMPDEIKIVRNNLTAKDYFNKGIKFLIDYYLKYKPFQDGTLELEKRILIRLDPEGKYQIQGFIDRLVKNPKTGEFEIHDYKTANSLPSKEKINTDRQLALYSIGVKELFNTQSNVNLVWHYLAHNTKIVSKRTNQQLEKLRQDIINLIKEIESTTEFPTYTSVLCDWCEYKTMCKAWGGRINEKQSKIDSHIPTPEEELKYEIGDESTKPEGLDFRY
jgi:putative RecB family exonuclease